MKCSAVCSSLICALAFVIVPTVLSDSYSLKTLAKKSDEIQGRIEPISTGLIVSAVAPMVLNLFTGLLGNLFNKPNDTEQRVVYGRPMTVKLCGAGNCIQLLDKGSGLTTVGKGDTIQHAMGDAIGEMLSSLLQRSLLSMHDLCREHVHFPHPDTVNCRGVEINTCRLSQATVPEAECVDTHGSTYCQKMKSHCKESLYSTFMTHNCYKTCSDNCYKPVATGPCDY